MSHLVHALSMAFAMFWEILWALILGFGLSGVVQAVVSKKQITRLLPDDSPRAIAIACGLGAASSSCSYAAVALARSIFRKGADFTAAIAFELASTNLVIELGIILAILLGWRFTLAEFAGGPLMVAILVILFRMFLTKPMVDAARRQAEKGLKGKMEGHAEMDMSVTSGSLLQKILSKRGFTAISHYFVMDWLAVWKDIALGLLIAGGISAMVPATFWNRFFFVKHPLFAKFWGPIVGPFVAILSFVDIYRKYYGLKMSAFLLVTMYAAMTTAAIIIELVFDALHLIPAERHAKIIEASIRWNYTTILNIVFGAVALLLVWRFFTTGGVKMIKMMDAPAHSARH